MSFCTLPYRWKASAYLHHNVGLVVTSAAQSFWAYLFCSTLMTDMGTSYSYLAQRFASPVTNSHKQQPLLLFLLISAGYFVNLAKSYSQPFTFVKSQGFISDSVLQAVLAPLDKTEKCKHCMTNSWDH